MELKSDKQHYDTIDVIDLDIAFPGDLQTYTVKPEDTLADEGDEWTLTFANGAGGVTFNMKHAYWYATRKRTIRVAAPVDQSGQSAAGAPPANTSSTPR